ncbi:TlpA disulfide reductase family protein [Pedobacter sp. KR3-3]|uniref:TlpA disulfide reductase family protein n=1 Tax=Pedobacter albus TaxID=3113905 RepID=A0ABU7I9P1_9SPHI|nr:TlpA disulfide reductase family protein [Pedobacter sp. KR3-3]MEE1946205.1 TlpA disulfide reductase family protein [Pedobacter sp. KR3-3]
MKTIQKLRLGAVLCLLITNLQAQTNTWVTLKGQLKGFNNQVEVQDMSEFQYLLPPSTTRMILADSMGHFSIRFKVASPNYFRLGRNQLYLSPGDDLEVFIDYGDPKKASFKGKGAEANAYLKATPFPKGGSFIEAGSQVKPMMEETFTAIEAMAAQRGQELAKLSKVSPEFLRLEKARVKADLINSYQSGKFYSTYKLKLKDEKAKEFEAQYEKAIEPKVKALSQNFTDASLMKLVVYRDVAEDVVKQGGKPADIQAITDWYKASDLVNAMQKVKDKQQLEAFKTQIATLKTTAFKEAANASLKQLMAFGKGDLAVDFVATDLNGKAVSLSSLKGKVIYVDLWATWCGPCMQEMPHFEKLKALYKDNPNVVLLSLSIDDDASLWKNSVNERKANGYQWLINRAKLQAYNIVGIPRSLLIDKNFKMVEMSAPMPSEANAAKAINALLE